MSKIEDLFDGLPGDPISSTYGYYGVGFIIIRAWMYYQGRDSWIGNEIKGVSFWVVTYYALK